MAVRTITWTVGEDMEVSPASIKKAGVQGDHHATLVEFKVPVKLQTGYNLYIQQLSSTDSYDITDALTVEEGKVSFLLPISWTQDGGKAILRLVASERDVAEGTEPETVYSDKARIVYADRQTGFARVQSLITGAIHQMMEICKSAVAKVDRAGEAAENFVEQLPDLAAGKNCYRVIEQNKHVAMGMWVGTVDEYEALEEKPNNALVFQTDDPELDNLKAYITDLETKVDNLETALGNVNACVTVTVLSDFNTFTSDGLFYFNYFAHLNSPVESGINGFLRVYSNRGNGFAVQLLFQIGGSAEYEGGVFYRKQYSGTWGVWKKFTLTAV